MAKDNELGRDRLLCTRTDEVVRSHHEATLDCVEKINQVRSKWHRLETLLRLLSEQHGKPSEPLEAAEFELGLREGLLRSFINLDFLPGSQYCRGYEIGSKY